MTPTLSSIATLTRQRILRLIWTRERSAGEIAAEFDVTFGAISQHLTAMLESGVVRVRRDGRRRFYAANRDALGPFARAFEQLWRERLDVLKEMAEDEQRRLDASRTTTQRAPRSARRSMPARQQKKGRRG